MTYMPNTPRTTAAGLAKYTWLRITNPGSVRYFGVDVPFEGQAGRYRRRIYRGVHERPEILAVQALLRPDDVVLEIGAGIGVVSAVIASRLDGPNLHAFEANPALIPVIEATLARNGLTAHVQQAAIGLEDGEAEFYIADNTDSSSLVDRGLGAATRVRVAALGRVLRETGANFVVMDVEGAERELLAPPLPPQVRAVCVETHPHVIGDEAVSAVIASLLGQGFVLRLDQSGRRVLAFERGGAGRVA
jgi:FkbM family methyltransferase